MQTNNKENPVVGTAGLDKENGGKLFSNPIVPLQPDGVNNLKSHPEVLARVYRLLLAGGSDA
jgi:hypothetical protein